jgi:hypothetical protein
VNTANGDPLGLPINFERTPVPGVPLEVVRYVLTLPDEVRQWFGNFLLDSTVPGFDGTPETSARLWEDELGRRADDAVAHPESLLSAEECLRQVREHLEQLRRTPKPDNLHGYHCQDYFADGWAERGHYDEQSRSWVVSPLRELQPEQRLGFFAVGRSGCDGIQFCYRYGHHGIWAYYPLTGEFAFLAPTLAAFVEGWCSGALSV